MINPFRTFWRWLRQSDLIEQHEERLRAVNVNYWECKKSLSRYQEAYAEMGRSNRALEVAAERARTYAESRFPEELREKLHVGCVYSFPAYWVEGVGPTIFPDATEEPKRRGIDEVMVSLRFGVDQKSPVPAKIIARQVFDQNLDALTAIIAERTGQ